MRMATPTDQEILQAVKEHLVHMLHEAWGNWRAHCSHFGVKSSISSSDFCSVEFPKPEHIENCVRGSRGYSHKESLKILATASNGMPVVFPVEVSFEAAPTWSHRVLRHAKQVWIGTPVVANSARNIRAQEGLEISVFINWPKDGSPMSIPLSRASVGRGRRLLSIQVTYKGETTTAKAGAPLEWWAKGQPPE